MARHRDLLSFSKAMNSLAKRVPEANSELAIQVARSILREMVYVTPVDTTQALSNWQVSLSQPKQNSTPAHYEGSHGSSKSASAQMVLALADVALKLKKPGQTIWIVNNISYIGDLDNGYSRQFAGGFTTLARVVATRVVSRTGIKL